ncbi:uncharacterized protein FA14DRAFT_31653 [Meira miltonrushii]|uniref:Uncharacterized protein n=1 Tax=Meira miltonrushii TaxID=1280837 RepID=A0A316VEX4_9BASI|nr:uncharacterized protein FA14DRAFT_31653 [Meira miltonrushii]PWN34551.1 hypothetical protein FA14DRAFT_31653 [Meira miltonrushii]
MRTDVEDVMAYCQGVKSIDEVLDTLLEPVHHYKSESERRTVYEVWLIIVKAAEETPFQEQEPIVCLCETLKQRKVPIDEESKRDWRLNDDELDDDSQPPPFLGAIIREELDIVSDHSDAYINLCAFSAYLTICSTANLGDYCLHALWMIREAFEDHESIADLVLHQSITKIRAARVWLQIAGSRLNKACLENEEFFGKMGTIGKGAQSELDESIKGFTIGRWQFWHSRIEGLYQTSRLDDEMRQECKLALQAMNESGR